ncbi:MAG: hypothetical protein O6947_07845 [Acidobacteria bacterium]|nr:hypothetical protein [Acidobacteriota bacterium]
MPISGQVKGSRFQAARISVWILAILSPWPLLPPAFGTNWEWRAEFTPASSREMAAQYEELHSLRLEGVRGFPVKDVHRLFSPTIRERSQTCPNAMSCSRSDGPPGDGFRLE